MSKINYIRVSLTKVKAMMATWRNGYAEDCKSLYPGSIPGVASKKKSCFRLKKK